MSYKKYDSTFKEEAVNLALSSKLTYAEIARDLGLNYPTLCKWIKQAMNKSKSPSNITKNPAKQDYQALERQNKALQKELEIRKKEIEFLKKASAYFASLK